MLTTPPPPTGQLQKMGVLSSGKPQPQTTPSAKRRSAQLDFGSLGPLKTTGTVGFSAFRDNAGPRVKTHTKSNGSLGGHEMDEDSDDEDDDREPVILDKLEESEAKYDKTKLGPDDAQFSGELADGVNRIRV